jgi:hypothetical protein
MVLLHYEFEQTRSLPARFATPHFIGGKINSPLSVEHTPAAGSSAQRRDFIDEEKGRPAPPLNGDYPAEALDSQGLLMEVAMRRS